MKKTVLSLFIVFALFACSNNEKKVKELARIASEKFDKGDWEGAERDLEQAITLDKNNDSLLFKLGSYKHFNAKFKDAIQMYSEAIRLNPKFASAYNNRGLCYGLIGEHDKSIVDFIEALKIDSTLPSALYNAGNYYYDREQFPEAIAYYTKSMSYRENYKDAYFNRAESYLLSGKFNESLSDYSKYLELSPNDKDAIRGKAECYEKLGMKDSADVYYAKVNDANVVD